ncbi:MAG: LD-carboxypeptidase [Crocinitomicaceae bacterium]|nr:LD-carboxypeptidase [Crocinitomicaceae bacterium]|tara:strand:- start:32557 stop:33420 length:864 start_codon:yes stop_codon:yes gene_type:complete
MTNNTSITNRVSPKPLKKGDKIALVAPARFASKKLINEASELIEKAGFTPIVFDGLDSRSNQFGGDDEHRASLLNQAFCDTSIRAALALRGGYGSSRLLSLLDVEAYLKDPTWIVGFSDITALHAWSNNLGIASLHAPVASTMKSTNEEDVQWIWDTLSGNPPRVFDGTIVGGNLSVLYSLLGTSYFPDCTDSYLFIEDLDEFLYHIDRMMVSLKLAGVFEQARGLIVGSFTDLKDNTKEYGQSIDNPFGLNYKEIINNHVPEGYLVRFDMPMGHGERNYPIILGAP